MLAGGVRGGCWGPPRPLSSWKKAALGAIKGHCGAVPRAVGGGTGRSPPRGLRPGLMPVPPPGCRGSEWGGLCGGVCVSLGRPCREAGRGGDLGAGPGAARGVGSGAGEP